MADRYSISDVEALAAHLATVLARHAEGHATAVNVADAALGWAADHGFQWQQPGKELQTEVRDERGHFLGFQPRDCGEHRTVGEHRAWCHDCREWCYPHDGCTRCQTAAMRTAQERAQVAERGPGGER